MKIKPTDSIYAGETLVDIGDGLAKCVIHAGLTKREYFAIMFAQGMQAFGDASCGYVDNEIPALAVKQADALIEELNK